MSQITVARTIRAPIAEVFRVITDIENLPASNPDVIRVEFLSDQHRGAGTRFLETRGGKRKQVVTELELTECEENERARFVSDMGGTIWDTMFSFRPKGSPQGSETQLEIRLDARPYKLLAKIMNPLINGMVRKGMQSHIDSIGDYCEGQTELA